MLLVAVLWPSLGWTKEKGIILEQVVAIVNNEIILLSDWNRRFALMKRQLRQIIDPEERKKRGKQLRKEVLQGMIDELLLDQKARKLQLNASDAEIENSIKDIKKRHQLSDAQFLEALRQQGYTLTTYKVMVRKQLRKLKLMQRELRKKVQVSKEDVQSFYKRVVGDIKPSAPEYHMHHIVFMVKKGADAKTTTDIQRQAKNMLQLARQKPKNFKVLTKRFAKSNAAIQGGDLDFLKPDDIHPNIAKVMVKMKTGEVHGGLVRSPMGFHILYLEETRSSGVKSLKEAQGEIRRKLQQQAFSRVAKRYVEQLRKNSVIELRPVRH